jgi:transposase
MTEKNKYSRRAKISERKFREIVKLFALDLNAKQIAELTKINRNTINRYLKALRQKIAEFCELESPFSGEVEVDESWFGAKWVKGKRGRGAAGKQWYLEYLNAMERFIQKSFLMAPALFYRLLFEEKLP